MWDLWKARLARQVVLRTLQPFAERCGSLPEGSAMVPHVLGFLSKIVTLLAIRHSGELQSHAMASVQSSVITALTGAGRDIVGEDIHFLSSIEDPEFAAGCRGAARFFRDLMALDLDSETRPPELADAQNALDELWREHVTNKLPAAEELL